MAGRIRTLKPEWLEDQRLLACSERARLLTVVLILIADDYGNGRGHPDFVKAQAGLYDVTTPDLESALFELQSCGFIELYLHNQQSYFSIRNWDKHQRVDKPGKPRVPPPSERDNPEAERPRKSSYFIRGTLTGLIKIGESIDPVARLGDLAACGSEPLELLAVCSVPERALHAELAEHRVHGEWFTPSDAVIAKIREHSRGAISVLATAGYANGRKVLESVEKHPAEFLTDHDHDHERTTTGNSLLHASRDEEHPVKKPSRKRPATRIPDGFAPDDTHRTYAQSNALDLDVEVEAFRLHHEAKDSAFASWSAALSTWLRNAVKFRRSGPQGGVRRGGYGATAGSEVADLLSGIPPEEFNVPRRNP